MTPLVEPTTCRLFFFSREEFPWFEKATIAQLSDVQRPTLNHLYWPQLDVDLAVESIRNPGAFPLVSKAAV